MTAFASLEAEITAQAYADELEVEVNDAQAALLTAQSELATAEAAEVLTYATELRTVSKCRKCS